MTLQKLEIEQALKSKAPAIIWNLISTADGMTRWLADTVTQEGDMLTFHWGHEWDHNEQRTAHITYKKKQHAIRFVWMDETAPEFYVELKMQRSDITNDFVLSITDFAEDGDMEWLQSIWERNFKRLERTGVL